MNSCGSRIEAGTSGHLPEGVGSSPNLPLHIRAVELKDANAFVLTYHRHHKPVPGHRFSLGAFVGDKLVGVSIVGRPKARHTDQRRILEVNRLCTDGTRNACSALYGASARAGKALGYLRIQTFILDSEPGTSLRASGWRLDRTSPGGQWKHTGFQAGGGINRTDQPICPKQCWVRDLC